MSSKSDRPYDIILFGATGFTGKLTAEHITTSLPTDIKWAVAGRNESKLQSVISDLVALNPDRPRPSIEICDLDPSSLRRLAQRTRVLITTVGPYHTYGSPVVEACAGAGTHYVDCTGETPWVYDMVQRYHDLAARNGAIIIPQCGIESAPADVIAYAMASFNRKKFDAGTAGLTHSVQKYRGSVSGGTALTAITVVESYSLPFLVKSTQPFCLAVGRPTEAVSAVPLTRGLIGTQQVDGVGLLTDSLLGMQDTTMVNRSWGLIDGGKFYGNRFSYNNGMIAGGRVSGFLWHLAVNVGTLMTFLPPVRWLLKRIATQPGSGPAKEKHSKHYVYFKSIAETDSSPSKKSVCDAYYKGDMYKLTGILLAEAALTLLRPDRENWAQKLGGGLLTPSTLGEQFIERLDEAGLKIDVKEA